MCFCMQSGIFWQNDLSINYNITIKDTKSFRLIYIVLLPLRQKRLVSKVRKEHAFVRGEYLHKSLGQQVRKDARCSELYLRHVLLHCDLIVQLFKCGQEHNLFSSGGVMDHRIARNIPDLCPDCQAEDNMRALLCVAWDQSGDCGGG